jgi:hypothetical protein
MCPGRADGLDTPFPEDEFCEWCSGILVTDFRLRQAVRQANGALLQGLSRECIGREAECVYRRLRMSGKVVVVMWDTAWALTNANAGGGVFCVKLLGSR